VRLAIAEPASPSVNRLAHPKILGIGTANPPYRVGQSEVRAGVEALFSGYPGLERLVGIFENTGIESRYWAKPIDWYKTSHPFSEKNAAWSEGALSLCEQASREALRAAGKRPADIAGVVFVTTTGIATPSLESYLIQNLGIPQTAIRLPIWGLGCAGGAAGLARAAELALLRQKPILFVAVELCSLTFIPGDRSKSNIVATSLFADGVAAMILGYSPRGGEGIDHGHVPGPEVVGSFTGLLPNSYDVMGWELIHDGLQVRFAQSIPSLVEGELGNLIREGLASYDLTAEEVDLWTLHPGGAKVLAAYRDGLGVDEVSLEASYGVLKKFGNMSSPTVLFVLQRQMYQLERPKPGSRGVLLALGPGFAAEGVVLQW